MLCLVCFGGRLFVCNKSFCLSEKKNIFYFLFFGISIFIISIFIISIFIISIFIISIAVLLLFCVGVG